MKSFGDRAAEEVTTRDVNAMLAQLAATGLAPRTVNKSRQLVCAIYNYGCREATFGLARNPATAADRRPEPECRGRSPSDLGRYHFQSPRSFMVAGNTATTTGAAVVTTPAVALIPRTTASAMRMPRSKASRMPLSSR
jgi:hypothetical protein